MLITLNCYDCTEMRYLATSAWKCVARTLDVNMHASSTHPHLLNDEPRRDFTTNFYYAVVEWHMTHNKYWYGKKSHCCQAARLLCLLDPRVYRTLFAFPFIVYKRKQNATREINFMSCVRCSIINFIVIGLIKKKTFTFSTPLKWTAICSNHGTTYIYFEYFACTCWRNFFIC